jgi:hypothetical protein
MAVSTIQNASLASGVPSASNITTGTLPKAQLPTGSVIQVVSANKTGSFSSGSTSYVDVTGLTVSITPTSASNKILVLVTQNFMHYQNHNNSRDFYTRLLRGATELYEKYTGSAGGTSSNGYFYSSLDGSMMYLDSPATTSSVTYKTQIRTNNGASDTLLFINNTGGPSVITVMEIAA